jgi:hypothetical protein
LNLGNYATVPEFIAVLTPNFQPNGSPRIQEETPIQ